MCQPVAGRIFAELQRGGRQGPDHHASRRDRQNETARMKGYLRYLGPVLVLGILALALALLYWQVRRYDPDEVAASIRRIPSAHLAAAISDGSRQRYMLFPPAPAASILPSAEKASD